jgi:hypothetical protein
MQFNHQFTDAREVWCAMASRITYTFLCQFLIIIAVTWFSQVTWLEQQFDFYRRWTQYYTAEVDW